MGKKIKIGKQRKDKYYRLAKEAGYRSRAAFKLIQLNKRFEFLSNSRVLVDLCAAPGGWLQVASQNMPMPSLCIGVDLVPIKPIKNTVTLLGDITVEKTKQMIKRELQTWEADCIIHDGAPNVGQNWIHDAFQQNRLTLSALKLAVEILAKNGWFITKIFRSKDYTGLIRLFEQLFKKVHIWKPAASRLESAEIFVVCEKYRKSQKFDAALFNIEIVFKEDDSESTCYKPQNLLHVAKKPKKAKALGYDNSESGLLFNRILASEFLESKDPFELLTKAHEIALDDEKLSKNSHTTVEVCECLKDIKVCGPREIRAILSWRRKIRADLAKEQKNQLEMNESEIPEKITEEEIESQESIEIREQILVATIEEKSALKRKKRKILREKSREHNKKHLKMVIEGDIPDFPEQQDLFALKHIKKAKHLDIVLNEKMLNINDESDSEGINSDNEEIDDDNPLLITEESGLNTEHRLKLRTEQWFSSNALSGILDEDEDICAVEKHIERRNKSASKIVEKTVKMDENCALLDEEKPIFADEIDSRRKFDPELLCLGEKMIYSSKSRRDLEDFAWNRYTNNDEQLPDWFVDDEQKHFRKQLPITKVIEKN